LLAPSWGGDEPRWTVHAVYVDSNQRYSDDFHGKTALEAQIACQLDRLADEGWMTRVEVACVIDRLTGKVADEETFTSEAEIESFCSMVKALVNLARPRLGNPPKGRDIEAAEAYDRKMRSLEFWEAVLRADRALRSELDELYERYEPEYDDGETVFTDSRGVEDHIDVLDAFSCLVEMAEGLVDTSKPGPDPKASGVFQVLQGRLSIKYFGNRIAKVLNGQELKAV